MLENIVAFAKGLWAKAWGYVTSFRLTKKNFHWVFAAAALVLIFFVFWIWHGFLAGVVIPLLVAAFVFGVSKALAVIESKLPEA